MRVVKVAGIWMTRAAAQNVEETGTSVAEDLAALRDGRGGSQDLLIHLLDGCDSDREQGWRDYVAALEVAL